MKFTVHGVQSFIKGHRKSGVISIKHSGDITLIKLAHLQWNNVCFLPVNATLDMQSWLVGLSYVRM